MTLHAQISTSVDSAIVSPGEFLTIDRHKSNLIRVDPGADWGSYRAVVFAPSVYEPSNPRRALSGCQVKKLQTALDASLHTAFFDTMGRPGRVLEVKPVITDAKRAYPWVNAISFAAIQAAVIYGAASVRYDLFDAARGSRIGEIASKRSARPWNVYPWEFLHSFQAMGHASAILRRDARMLRKDLNRIAKLPLSPAASEASRGTI